MVILVAVGFWLYPKDPNRPSTRFDLYDEVDPPKNPKFKWNLVSTDSISLASGGEQALVLPGSGNYQVRIKGTFPLRLGLAPESKSGEPQWISAGAMELQETIEGGKGQVYILQDTRYSTMPSADVRSQSAMTLQNRVEVVLYRWECTANCSQIPGQ
jgi:hypothetical protein